MPQLKRSAGRQLVLHGVDWPTYTRLLRTFAERPAIRLTFDRGTLEIMAPLLNHETGGNFLVHLMAQRFNSIPLCV